MYSNQGLGAERGARARASPWEMRQEAGNVPLPAEAVNVQGIKNDFILDKMTLKMEHIDGEVK